MAIASDLLNAEDRMSVDVTKKSTYWSHLARGLACLVLGAALSLMVATVGVPFYTPILAWFAMFYLIAGAVCVAIGSLITRQKSRQHPHLTDLGSFCAEAVVAVGLTAVYAATIVPLYSGSRVSQLVGIQVGNSIVCLTGAVAVAIIWTFIAAARTRRKGV